MVKHELMTPMSYPNLPRKSGESATDLGDVTPDGSPHSQSTSQRCEHAESDYPQRFGSGHDDMLGCLVA